MVIVFFFFLFYSKTPTDLSISKRSYKHIKYSFPFSLLISWRPPSHSLLFCSNLNLFFFRHGTKLSFEFSFAFLYSKTFLSQFIFWSFLMFYYGKSSVYTKVKRTKYLIPRVLFMYSMSISIYQFMASLGLAIP